MNRPRVEKAFLSHEGAGPDVRSVPIPQCGRLCQEERPDVVNGELLELLADWNG